MNVEASKYLAAIGRRGGKAKSAAKTSAARKNAKRGGWPKGKLRKALKELDAFEANSKLANLVVGPRKPKASVRRHNDQALPQGGAKETHE